MAKRTPTPLEVTMKRNGNDVAGIHDSLMDEFKQDVVEQVKGDRNPLSRIMTVGALYDNTFKNKM